MRGEGGGGQSGHCWKGKSCEVVCNVWWNDNNLHVSRDYQLDGF